MSMAVILRFLCVIFALPAARLSIHICGAARSLLHEGNQKGKASDVMASLHAQNSLIVTLRFLDQ